MPRPPKIRISYRQDASFLLRLSEAVAMDHNLQPEYRADLVSSLETCARKIMDARFHRIDPVAGVTDDEVKEG